MPRISPATTAPASVQTPEEWHKKCCGLDQIIKKNVGMLDRESSHTNVKLWSEIIFAINSLADMAETRTARRKDRSQAKKSLAAAFEDVKSSWHLDCGRLDQAVVYNVQQMRAEKDLDTSNLWSMSISKIDLLVSMVRASKGRSKTHHEIAQSSLASALGVVCVEMERLTSLSKPTDLEQYIKALKKTENNDILNIIIISLKAWRMAETKGNSDGKNEISAGFTARLRPEPKVSPLDLAGEYEKAYSETLAISERVKAECAQIEAETASKIALLKDEFEQAAIKFEPYFQAKVLEEYQRIKPISIPDRTSFADWITGEAQNLGLLLFESGKNKPAHLIVIAGTGQYRLRWDGETNGLTSRNLEAFFPLQLTAGGKRNLLVEEQIRPVRTEPNKQTREI